jgi:hypothetical protein
MSKVHNFSEGLKKGQAMEAEFLALYPDKLERLDGRGADFKILRTGETIELKVDTYDPESTPNFYMELYSHGEKFGGPFAAAEKGVTFYVYRFQKTGLTYVYRVTTLVAYLRANYPKPWLIGVKNQGYVTRGFLVKRVALEKIQLNLEDIL